ncbi:MAG: hypothetical protein KY475_02415 [Planctomycetes bacterium]|nr:hypothetical protein [Planctomycetota bacterium]
MTTKEPVLLTVLIETAPLRWFVAGVTLQGEPLPLMRSEDGNLRDYVGAAFDEQVSFLRHRLAGVLQRGCDRLWGRRKKPCQIVFVADGPFTEAAAELTPAVAEHFIQWMVSPPCAFFIAKGGFAANKKPSLKRIAGELDSTHQGALESCLPALLEAMRNDEAWELSQGKQSGR